MTGARRGEEATAPTSSPCRTTARVSTCLLHLLALAVAFSCSLPAEAHDPSAWGGLFRSRDHGARWLPVNEGRFIGAALGLAISPSDPHHLLLGTDSGLLRSRNGGRDWQSEAPAALIGSVFAVAFHADGVRAFASTAQGVFRTDDGFTWQRTPLAKDALPARAIVTGAASRVHVAGANGLWRSDDSGLSWVAQSDGLPDGPVSTLLVAAPEYDLMWVIVGGRLWSRPEKEGLWAASDEGLPEGRIETVASSPDNPARLWAVAADQLYRSDDRGRSWVPVGQPLPEPNTAVRGISVTPAHAAIVLTTHRGLYRSADGGGTWELQEGMLPIHLEAGPLVHEPADPATLYAGFAVTPYDAMWRMATRGGTMLGRLDAMSIAGAVAFLVVMGICAIAALRGLSRHYGTQAPRVTSSTAGRTR